LAEGARDDEISALVIGELHDVVTDRPLAF
jgi:hypothetical protein